MNYFYTVLSYEMKNFKLPISNHETIFWSILANTGFAFLGHDRGIYKFWERNWFVKLKGLRWMLQLCMELSCKTGTLFAIYHLETLPCMAWNHQVIVVKEKKKIYHNELNLVSLEGFNLKGSKLWFKVILWGIVIWLPWNKFIEHLFMSQFRHIFIEATWLSSLVLMGPRIIIHRLGI